MFRKFLKMSTLAVFLYQCWVAMTKLLETSTVEVTSKTTFDKVEKPREDEKNYRFFQ